MRCLRGRWAALAGVEQISFKEELPDDRCCHPSDGTYVNVRKRRRVHRNALHGLDTSKAAALLVWREMDLFGAACVIGDHRTRPEEQMDGILVAELNKRTREEVCRKSYE